MLICFLEKLQINNHNSSEQKIKQLLPKVILELKLEF